MATLRFQALDKATSRKPVSFEETARKSEIFGSNVFGDKAMRQFLTSDAYKAVKNAIEQLGATLDNTIRTRVFLTDIDEWPAVAKAHGVYFASAMPASSFVGGVKLMLPELCVEFEATLWVD